MEGHALLRASGVAGPRGVGGGGGASLIPGVSRTQAHALPSRHGSSSQQSAPWRGELNAATELIARAALSLQNGGTGPSPSAL